MPRPSQFDTRGVTSSRPTPEDRGLTRARRAPEEDALASWAKSRGYALDFRPRSPQDGVPLREEDGLLQWARDRGYALDFVPQDSQGADSSVPERRRAKKGAGGSPGVKAVQSDPRLTAQLRDGPGIRFVGTRGQNFARPETIGAIEAVGREWEARRQQRRDLPRIRIGGIGIVYGGPLQKGVDKLGMPAYHKSHQIGLDVDVRLMRKDGEERDTDIRSPDYSRERTREVIELFQQQNIDRIFFNDPAIPGVQYQDGHSNHFHVRFLPPSR